MKSMLKVVEKIFQPKSLIIFDAGGNSGKIKKKIREMGFNFLTLKPKKVKTYKKHVRNFKKEESTNISMNHREYYFIKKKEGDEFFYIFFSPQLFEDQIRKKERKFERQKDKGNKLAEKAEKHKFVNKYPCDKGVD